MSVVEVVSRSLPQKAVPPATASWMRIGELSRRVGVSVERLRVVYLGADTPIDMVVQAAAATEPDLVVVYAAMTERLEPHRDALTELGAGWPCAIAGEGASPALAESAGVRHLADDPITTAEALSTFASGRERTG